MDICEDLAANAAMGDKNNTTEDSSTHVGNKRFPQRIMRAILKKTAEDHVMNNNHDDWE